jgi:hypothetical protein
MVDDIGSLPPWDPDSNASFGRDREMKFNSFGYRVFLPFWQGIKVKAEITFHRPHSLIGDHVFRNRYDNVASTISA